MRNAWRGAFRINLQSSPSSSPRAREYARPPPPLGELKMDKKLFQRDPRDYALSRVEDGLVSADAMLLCMIKYMSHDDVRGALDANELSPRFEEEEAEEE